ncbi:hypothetical protein C4572_03795 [Candidatus Parcubacteria bacterium]|nr:MAG: hypothetical protein C4572_03795 [Candidatus Parcubacteria bacterium]
MEEKLSFIPKKSLNSQTARRSGGGFVMFAFLIFLISAGLWGGLFMYKRYLNDRISQLGKALENRKSSFELATINEVVNFSGKIDLAEKLLKSHKSVSNVFDFLQDFTAKDIKFNDLSYSFADGIEPSIALSGSAKSYSTIASQVKAFESYSLVKQVSVSGLNSDAAGNVRFNIRISFDPSIIAYKANN